MDRRKVSGIGETVNDGEHAMEVTSLSGSKNEAVAVVKNLFIKGIAGTGAMIR